MTHYGHYANGTAVNMSSANPWTLDDGTKINPTRTNITFTPAKNYKLDYNTKDQYVTGVQLTANTAYTISTTACAYTLYE